jgi:cobalt-zinc-cadmium efflux system protein
MLEDVLGWAVVLVGAIVMRFTDFTLIDPIMSICVALFILISAGKNLKEIFDLLLEKAPLEVDVNEIREHLLKIEGVSDVHHIHIWSMDGSNNYATMHIISNADQQKIKRAVREELSEHGISHSTLELEREDETCDEKHCHVDAESHTGHHHHHHHHHG